MSRECLVWVLAIMEAEIHTGMGCVARGYKYTSLEVLNNRQLGWAWMVEGKPRRERLGNSWPSFTALMILRVRLSSLSGEWYYKKTFLIPCFCATAWFVGHFLCFWLVTWTEKLSQIRGEPSFRSTPLPAVDGAVSLPVHSRSLGWAGTLPEFLFCYGICFSVRL